MQNPNVLDLTFKLSQKVDQAIIRKEQKSGFNQSYRICQDTEARKHTCNVKTQNKSV